MTSPLIIFGLIIAVSASVFIIVHNYVITEYSCKEIKDQILLQDCINASLPITPMQIMLVFGVSALLISIGIYKDKKSSNKKQNPKGVEQ